MTKEEYKEVVSYLKNIIIGTKWENHLFSVGGCVRDEIMNHSIKDVDLVVDLPNGGIEFANWLCERCYLIHQPVIYETYGTAMFKLLEFTDLELEIVETRKEQYKDKSSRNPEVAYGTLEEDCKRRDLTINALYYDITNDKIIDLVGGIDDIKNKIIRTPSDPNVVFNDDALRIMRCVRFKNRYEDWYMEDETLFGIIRNVKRLNTITQERITDEMIKSLMSAKHAGDVLRDWKKTGILNVILPELNFSDDRLFQIQDFLNKLSQSEIINVEIFFAALFKDKLEVLKRMKLSNDFIKMANRIVDSYKYYEHYKLYLSEPIIRMFGKEFGDIYEISMQFISSYTDDAEWIEKFSKIVHSLMYQGTMFNNNTQLPIDGNDIMKEFNLTPSKTVKWLINEAWKICYEKPTLTKKELLNELKGILMYEK